MRSSTLASLRYARGNRERASALAMAEEERYSILYWYDDRSSDQRWSLAAASTGVAESGAKILSKGRWSVYNMNSLA